METLWPKETLPDVIRRILAEPRENTLIERVDGIWTSTSSQKLLDRVHWLACAMRSEGLQRGDRIALIAHNCVDWIVVDFAAFFAGLVVVPVYPIQGVDQTCYILEDSEAKLLFVDTPAAYKRLAETGTALPPAMVFLPEAGKAAETHPLDAFEQRGMQLYIEQPDRVATFTAGITPDDMAVLMYTSGTTGTPKGIMLSHDNLVFDAKSAVSRDPGFQRDDPVLSVLPYSHIYEHVTIYMYLLMRLNYYICRDPSELLADLQTTEPTTINLVPRIFDRILDNVAARALKEGGIRGRLLLWALRVGRRYAYAKTFGPSPDAGLRMHYAIAAALVLKKIRHRLGLDRMRHLTSGGAALHTDVAMTFLGIGLPTTEGYGLTETSPIVTVNPPEANRYGTVGPPIPEVEVKIADDGEILTRGRHVMLGYYRDPAATAAVLVDGWLYTGDIGEFDERGYVRITDRKREIFKTAGGKFVVPARVEAAIRRSPFISQVMVVGEARPHPAVLVIPNWETLRARLRLPAALTPDQLAQCEDIRSFLTGEVAEMTKNLGGFEQIRRVFIILHEFTVESGELSPSMKIKRRVVEERYKDAIERGYQVDLHIQSFV